MEKWMKHFTDDIEVPQNVLDKVNEAFAQIEMESGDMINENQKNNKKLTSFQKSWNSMSRLSRVAAIAALALVLGSGSVFAANRIWGLKDVLRHLPKEAESQIVKEVAVEDTQNKLDEVPESLKVSDDELVQLEKNVSFAVKETLSDQNSCHIALEATLKDPVHYMLVDESDVTTAVDRTIYGDAKEGETVVEYAKRMNKKMIRVDSYFEAATKEQEQYLESYDVKMVDDAHCLMMLQITDNNNQIAGGTKLNIASVARVYDKESSVRWKVCKSETATVTIDKVSANEATASYAFADGKEMRVGDSSVILEKIELTNTAIETKIAVTVRNEDKELGNWVAVNLIDDNGNYYEGGVTNTGIASQPDAEGRFVDYHTYAKMELPDYVNVRVRDLNTDQIWELHNIPVCK